MPARYLGISFNRLQWANWTTSAGHLLLLAVAAQFEHRLAWVACLWLIAAISLFAWMGNVRRSRAITDTPTSRIASAAQGYVELAGTAVWPGDTPMLSALRQTPCCWFWFRVEKQGHKNNWSVEREGESSAPFVIEDGTGSCIVHPSEAEVHSHRRTAWNEGTRRYTELTLRPGDPIYAIGAFSTARAAEGPAAIRAGVAALLASWKREQPALLERFDLDRDGEIDLQEWGLARRQARREVERHREEQPPPPAVHLMRRPSDGRLFMVSNKDPGVLARKYLRWKWVHLAVFFAGIGVGTCILVS